MSWEIPEETVLNWRKAKRSANNGACVEVASTGGRIAVRDSKNPDGAWVRYSVQSWSDFVTNVAKIEQRFE